MNLKYFDVLSASGLIRDSGFWNVDCHTGTISEQHTYISIIYIYCATSNNIHSLYFLVHTQITLLSRRRKKKVIYDDITSYYNSFHTSVNLLHYHYYYVRVPCQPTTIIIIILILRMDDHHHKKSITSSNNIYYQIGNTFIRYVLLYFRNSCVCV